MLVETQVMKALKVMGHSSSSFNDLLTSNDRAILDHPSDEIIQGHKCDCIVSHLFNDLEISENSESNRTQGSSGVSVEGLLMPGS